MLNVSSIAATSSGATATVSPKDLGKDDFLRLLAAQLRNQDPLNPMSNTEFIAQMAQFSALEQMYNLNESFNRFGDSLNDSLNILREELKADLQANVMLQAVVLIGKEVTATVDAGTITGKVSKISWTDAGAILTVEGKEVPLIAVTEVAVPEVPPLFSDSPQQSV
ncbi:MAG: flagellar hook capping protein [Moorella sp. (in: Bacteria)]|nr:flagellar hook capping protein [Moorella sp. (in: firmicutes)]